MGFGRRVGVAGLVLVSACLSTSCNTGKKAGNATPKTFYTDPKMIALIEAVEKQDLPQIERRVKNGADIDGIGRTSADETNERRVTPLVWAFQQQKKESFQKLLDLGADPNQIVEGQGAVLHAATIDEIPDWLKLLLRARWRREPGRQRSTSAYFSGHHPVPDAAHQAPGRGGGRSQLPNAKRRHSADRRRPGRLLRSPRLFPGKRGRLQPAQGHGPPVVAGRADHPSCRSCPTAAIGRRAKR